MVDKNNNIQFNIVAQRWLIYAHCTDQGIEPKSQPVYTRKDDAGSGDIFILT